MPPADSTDMDADKAQRYRSRMQRQKAVVDAAIVRADKAKGCCWY